MWDQPQELPQHGIQSRIPDWVRYPTNGGVLKVGVAVQRGRDWYEGNQDGGPDNVGFVVGWLDEHGSRHGEYGDVGRLENTAVNVKWAAIDGLFHYKFDARGRSLDPLLEVEILPPGGETVSPTCPTCGHSMVVSDGDGHYSEFECDRCDDSGKNKRWFCSTCHNDYCFSCTPQEGLGVAYDVLGLLCKDLVLADTTRSIQKRHTPNSSYLSQPTYDDVSRR